MTPIAAAKENSTQGRKRSLAWLYPAALWAALAIQIAHIISIPLLITFDGQWYIRLAELVGTSKFASGWDYLRTPLFPALLKGAFWVFGKQALAVEAMQSVLVFLGIWMLSRILRRTGRPIEAAIVLVSLSAYPTLIAYEHAVLTEGGTFLFLAALAYILCLPARRPVLYVSALVGLIATGFYYRSSLVLLAPLAAILYAISSLRTRSDPRDGKQPRPLFHIIRDSLAIAVLPFVIAYPWQRNPKAEARVSESVVMYGLVRQAVIPPEDPRWGGEVQRYRSAIDGCPSPTGLLRVSCVQEAPSFALIEGFGGRQSTPVRLLAGAILSYPARYLAGVGRNLLLFAGLSRFESDNAGLRDAVFGSTGTAIASSPPGFPAIDSQFAHATGPSLVSQCLKDLAALYDFAIFLGFCATVGVLILGIRRKNMIMIQLAALPLGFILIQALVLSSQDRMVIPAYPLLLANLVLLPGWLWQRIHVDDTAGDRAFPGLDRLAFRSVLLFIGLLAACHLAYLLASRMIPSSDEAHYMSGVYSIAAGIRSGSLRTAFANYAAALGFKAPLICVPAALIMLVAGDPILASKLSLVLIFLGLGVASYSLFRNLFHPALAAFATALTVTAPIVTGLTHRFYVENLLLLIMIVYADRLIRRRLDSFRGSVLLGVLLGFGLLAKILILPVVLLPTLYIAYLSYRSIHGEGRVRAAAVIAARLAVIVAVATPIAYTWYGFHSHWAAVVDTAGAAAACPECVYPAVYAAFANFSSGPYFFVFVIAMAGAVRLAKWLRFSGTGQARIHAWTVILMLGIFIPLVNAAGPNKTVRYIALSVPTVSALAVFAATAWFRADTRLIRFLLVLVCVSAILVLHNSFDILPFQSLRVSDLRLIDSRYPLNPPGWVDDNHPLERRDFRLAEAADYIARDFRQNVAPGERGDVRVVVHGLFINFYYLNLISEIRHYALDFHPGWIPPGDPPAEYILSCSGCGSIYPEREYHEFEPSPKDLDSGRLPYTRFFTLKAPSGVVLTGFRHNAFGGAPVSVTGLKLLQGSTLNFIDHVSFTSTSASPEPHASRLRPLRITGWAVDSPDATAAAAVDIDIDGQVFSADYGALRSDVAAAFKNSNYTRSGYIADISLKELSAGEHRLTVRIVNRDRTGYYAGKTLTFMAD